MCDGGISCYPGGIETTPEGSNIYSTRALDERAHPSGVRCLFRIAGRCEWLINRGIGRAESNQYRKRNPISTASVQVISTGSEEVRKNRPHTLPVTNLAAILPHFAATGLIFQYSHRANQPDSFHLR